MLTRRRFALMQAVENAVYGSRNMGALRKGRIVITYRATRYSTPFQQSRLLLALPAKIFLVFTLSHMRGLNQGGTLNSCSIVIAGVQCRPVCAARPGFRSLFLFGDALSD